MLVTLAGMVTFVKAVLQNALFEIVVSVDGKDTAARAVLSSNALAPMVVTPSGMAISVRPQPLNAEEPTEVVFRGETLTINRKCYQCEDTGKQFTNEELDEDNQWATFRAYWENKGFEHFYDIDNYEGR